MSFIIPTPEIIADNIKIATFMGNNRRSIECIKPWHIEPYGWFMDDNMRYHDKWEWQIPVWAKISGLMYELTKANQEYGIYLFEFYANFLGAITSQDKITAQKIILEAINWYNENKKQ